MTEATLTRLHLVVRGAVQGVGFRPFIYRLADELHLKGWVNNSAQGVFVEVEGPQESLDNFLSRIESDKPPRALLQSLEPSFLDPVGFQNFEIRTSDDGGPKTALILPDTAVCPDCLREIFDPADRRYRYSFTNCTNCGPRFSIIEALPYDRPNTTMKHFPMCEACRAEYDQPLDRRFHAQPNACPVCGPHLELWDEQGGLLASHDDALRMAAEALRQGQIVAVKGLGGFQLMVDARSEDAVRRLRQRKRREAKPLALMFPSLDAVQEACSVAPMEARLLDSPEAPIVLLERKIPMDGVALAGAIAPGNPYLGVMLPYTPLHHLLLAETGFPAVATSGNLSDEPLCTDEREALERLNGIADVFLVHNRPIARHVDDSVVRVVLGRELMVRRARGYAPLPVTLPEAVPEVTLAVGAHLKNTSALAVKNQAFISQHIGDLETTTSFEAFQNVIQDFEALYASPAARVVCDAHPDYVSTHYAQQRDLPLQSVQHHFAHVLACTAENDLRGRVLGVAWDGTGYGPDGTIWGGEFLLVERGYQRLAHLRPFRLPGGSKAIQEPRRAALGLLHEIFGAVALEMDDLPPVRSCSVEERKVFGQLLEKGLNSPLTSSAGRLFDAVAALVGLQQVSSFEGQAAMALEFAAAGGDQEAYTLPLQEGTPLILDWEPLVRALIEDVRAEVPAGVIAARFHNTLARGIVEVARRAGEERVVLTGGCFQNKRLTEQVILGLTEGGFRPFWHQRLPPNDGSIALGQLMASIQGESLRKEEHDVFGYPR
jgi:hydrogenase maturation protein HypF